MKLDTRPDIAAKIAAKRAEQKRLPIHWDAKREALAEEIEQLVARWLEADG